MRKLFFVCAVLSALGYSSAAQQQADSLQQIQLEEVIVAGTRAGIGTPVAHTDLSGQRIKRENAARNLPLVLQTTPSLVAFTEDGTGVGNTSMRIRGTDATRINVTLNGMPLNNPESQEVFWVNLPDLSNALQSIQIQRGVGTSTNGSAAFGASISLKTTGARAKTYGEASTAVGSYNTFVSSVAAGTGVMKNGFSVDLRYSRVLSDGYIRNGKVNHSNLYTALSHYAERQLLRLSYIRGAQRTGITWEGVTAEQMEDKVYGRRYNVAGEYYDEAGNRLYYDNETDNYFSDIVQLIFSRELTDHLTLHSALSWNHGYGYYENYKTNRKFSSFGLLPQVIDGTTYTRSDMIRRKLMVNDFYVANIGMEYVRENLKVNFGAMYSLYDGDHFGQLPWIKYWVKEENTVNLKTFEWYRNNGKKGELNSFVKAEYQWNNRFSLFADVQYRGIDYRLKGIDDDLSDISKNFAYRFVNPKTGLFFHINNSNSLYASVAVGQREPLRADLKESIKGGEGDNRIRPELMIDYELGYRLKSESGLYAGANLYYMDYKNQMVQTGKLNDVGYKLMENVKNSYRTGLEVEVSVPLADNKLRIDANTTWSRNKIKNYTAYFDLYDSKEHWNEVYEVKNGKTLRKQAVQTLGTTDISFSPNMVGMASVTYQPVAAIYLNLTGKYVGKQFLDNTSDDAKSLDAYFTGYFSAGYTLRNTPLGDISIEGFVNNLFNKAYIANGWAASEMFENDGSKVHWIGYYPQAMRNYMVRLTVRF